MRLTPPAPARLRRLLGGAGVAWALVALALALTNVRALPPAMPTPAPAVAGAAEAGGTIEAGWPDGRPVQSLVRVAATLPALATAEDLGGSAPVASAPDAPLRRADRAGRAGRPRAPSRAISAADRCRALCVYRC